MPTLADLAREYGSIGESRPSNSFMRAVADMARLAQGGIDRAREATSFDIGGMNLSPYDLIGQPGRAVEKLVEPSQSVWTKSGSLDPDMIDLAGLAFPALKLAKGAATGTKLFAEGVGREMGSFATRPSRGPMVQLGAVGKDAKPKVLRKLEDEFASPEEARLAALGDFPTTKPARIVRETKEGGGYSVNLKTGKRPTEGYMVGKYENTDPRNTVVEGYPTRKPVQQHAQTNIEALQDPEHYLGTWFDPEGAKTYLDVSKRFEPDQLRAATKAGERTKQIAIWDLMAKEGKPVGNWEEFINSPEFKARMKELQGEGAEYMSKQGTPDWWDMHGTLFEDIYGQHLPQVAGFTASTAPVTPLRQNVQQASEYLRRHIKGEPIVQPDWRAGPGLLSTREGTKMPMETGRASNLEKAAAGRLDELSAEKVAAEARAMMGDPRAIVLDRHHVHMAEEPSKGVYVSATPHVIKGPQYSKLENVMAGAADEAAIPPRTYSAQLWAGIRERVRNTGELFGTKYDKPPGESKSYVDHLRDLTEEKAKHLGITPEEMKKRLKAGDDNLLAQMLAIPGVAALVGAGASLPEDDASQQ